MRTKRAIFLGLILALAAAAQTPLVNPEAARQTAEQRFVAMNARIDLRPATPLLNQAVGAMRTTAAVADDVKAEAAKLFDDAGALQKEGRASEARPMLFHAAALLRGRKWDVREQFGSSLLLRPTFVVADSEFPLMADIAATFPAPYSPADVLNVKISLAEYTAPASQDSATGVGKVIKELGSWAIPGRDFLSEPFRVDPAVTNLVDGDYMLVADVSEGQTPLARLLAPVHLVRGLGTRQQATEQALAKIAGHESTKATIWYPFDLARGLNTGRREVLSFDFATELKRSQELLAALQAGTDPLFRAKGLLRRNYVFPEAGMIMPYQVYVPSKWDGRSKLPMVVALHGSNLDESNMLSRAKATMQAQAETHGFIVVAPLGYQINGGYGNRPAGGGAGIVAAARPDPVRVKEGELSERDVLNVMELAAEEYNADRSRIYLMGNSMGGAGTYHIAGAHPERFAAIAPCAASSGPNASYPFDALKGKPILVVVGDQDGLQNSVKGNLKALQDHGLKPEYIEVPGGTHGTAIEIAMPQIFNFFDHAAVPNAK